MTSQTTAAGARTAELSLADELEKRSKWMTDRSRVADAILMQRAATTIRTAREVLEFYADHKNRTGGTILDMESSRFDGWSKARAAIAKNGGAA